jgi:hypothetical protein
VRNQIMPRQSLRTEKTVSPQPGPRQSHLSTRPHPFNVLHRTYGNQTMQRLIQSRLSVSQPHDKYEQEADAIAARTIEANEEVSAQHRPGSPASAAATSVPHPLLTTLGSGQRLSDSTRAFMEPRLGHDLDQVRVHTDFRAQAAARMFNALAFTLGRDIVFAKGEYAPETNAGKKLLAHELVHVSQQNQGVVARAIAADYDRIHHNLTYRFTDWAITDAEAREVLGILRGLSDRDLADTVAAMDRDGIVNRLLDNISDADAEREAVLIGRISHHRSATHSAEWIVDRLSYGIFDWAVTDQDTRQALEALMGLESQELRTVVGHMVNEGVFDRLMENLPEEVHRRFAAFISRLRDIRQEFLDLVSAHTAFLRGRPGGAGTTVRGTVSSTGYGSSTPLWPDLPGPVKDDWRRRARAAIASVTASVRGTDLEPILSRAGLVFEPEEAERLNAYAYVSGNNKLYFGCEWVKDAEADPRNVWQSIAHELGGHEEFGLTWSWEIMQATLQRLTPAERLVALSAANSVYSAYGYLETEIYAELRELSFRIPTSGGDLPSADVPKELTRILDAFGPDVGQQIALRLYYRVIGDPRVSAPAKDLLYQSIQSVFGLFPVVGVVNP